MNNDIKTFKKRIRNKTVKVVASTVIGLISLSTATYGTISLISDCLPETSEKYISQFDSSVTTTDKYTSIKSGAEKIYISYYRSVNADDNVRAVDKFTIIKYDEKLFTEAFETNNFSLIVDHLDGYETTYELINNPGEYQEGYFTISANYENDIVYYKLTPIEFATGTAIITLIYGAYYFGFFHPNCMNQFSSLGNLRDELTQKTMDKSNQNSTYNNENKSKNYVKKK